MSNFILYLTESAGSLIILYMVYWLFLRRDTFFMMNRLYLLGMVFFSLMVPLIPIPLLPSAQISDMIIMLEPVLISPEKVETIAAGNLQWIEIAWVIYITGVVIFTSRFLVQLMQLYFITRRSGINRHKDLRLVFVDRGYSPFSFFNLIFINDKEIPDDSLETILAHERVHVKQAHSCDLLIVEILTILQWFNPFAWLIGRDLKSIHEFLADEGVLRSGMDRTNYQEMILNKTMGIQVNNLTNNFNVSLLKKRIIMMTKIRSSMWTKIKFVLVLPAILLVISLLSASTTPVHLTGDNTGKPAVKQETHALPSGQQAGEKSPGTKAPSNPDTNVYSVVDKVPSFPGGQDACTKFILKNIRYPEEALKNGIKGTVFVTFIVKTDGTVTDVKIMRGIGGGCDEESLRVVSMMPKWIPGSIKGKPVNVAFVLPIKYTRELKLAPIPDNLKKSK